MMYCLTTRGVVPAQAGSSTPCTLDVARASLRRYCQTQHPWLLDPRFRGMTAEILNGLQYDP